MPRAYSYIRMSRPEQLRGDSLRRQKEAAEKWAADRGATLDETLTDIGVSAFRGKNRIKGALAAFLRLVEDGKIERGSYLLVESLDRLSREAVLETLPRFIELISAGIVIVTLIDGQEYSAERLRGDWTPLILSLAIMARAHEESKTKSVRITKVWNEKRKKAASEIVTKRVPAWLQVKDGKIVPIPERAAIVRRIFDETVQGFGKRAIAARLNKEGVAPFAQGDGWHSSYISKLLNSRAVYGVYQPLQYTEGGRVPWGEPIQNYYPQVVPEEVFLRAQNATRSRRHAAGRRGPQLPNIFIGLAKCGVCGGSMMYENKGERPKGGRYLVCGRFKRQAGCSNDRRWRLDKAEDLVLRTAPRLDISHLVSDGPHIDGGISAQELRKSIAELEESERNLVLLVERGHKPSVERTLAVAEQIRNLKKRLFEVEQEEALHQTAPSVLNRLEVLSKLQAALDAATSEEKCELRVRIAQELRSTFVRITFGKHRIAVTYRFRSKSAPHRVPAPGRPVPLPEATLFDDSPETVAYYNEQHHVAAAESLAESERNQRALAELMRRKGEERHGRGEETAR